MVLTVKQRGVRSGIIAGATITLVVLVAAILTDPIHLSPETSIGGRIAFALKTDAVIALWLAVSVGMLAHHRFFTPEDIDGGGLTRGTQKAQILQATLQNTLEQTVLSRTRAFNVGDHDAADLDLGDTSRRSSVLVWPGAIRARL